MCVISMKHHLSCPWKKYVHIHHPNIHFHTVNVCCTDMPISHVMTLLTNNQIGIIELFQLQMRTSFPFLRAMYLHRIILIILSRSFFSPVRREYIRKFSVHLIQKFCSHDLSNKVLSCSEREKINLMKSISKRDSKKTGTR